MDDWDLRRLAWRPHHPEILSSTQEGRSIVLDLPAGEAEDVRIVVELR
jgi:hypothetical protein